MRKVFVSYHHKNDQSYKDALIAFSKQHEIFIEKAVNTGDIDENLPADTIRRKIRDDYLADSTVTIVLVGSETRYRKHVDWEIYSSMFDGAVNKKSGILVIMLPYVSGQLGSIAHGDLEKKTVYPDVSSWSSIDTFKGYQERYPEMPDRILDNLMRKTAKISVVAWDRLNPERLRFLVEATAESRTQADYDLSRDMRMRNG